MVFKRFSLIADYYGESMGFGMRDICWCQSHNNLGLGASETYTSQHILPPESRCMTTMNDLDRWSMHYMGTFKILRWF